MQSRPLSGQYVVLGSVLFVFGCVLVVLDSAAWYYGQVIYSASGPGSVVALVQKYYLAETVAIGVALVGAYLVYRGLKSWKGLQDTNSVRFMLAEALSSRSDFRLGAVAAVAYAVVYLLVSSIIVFQPGANYEAWTGLAPLSWNVAACCGSIGTVPAFIFYVAPQVHFAVQVLPLDVLFAVVVPLLVGFNVTVAAHAVRNQDVRKNVGWVSSAGILAGLFTGCPTCAGLFLASAFGGIGATSLAVALAPYQMLFVVVSIPLLAASPFLVTLNARRAQLVACQIPNRGTGHT